MTNHQQYTQNNRSSLVLPKVKQESARKSFYFQGALVFNKLPFHVHQMNSIVLRHSKVEVLKRARLGGPGVWTGGNFLNSIS